MAPRRPRRTHRRSRIGLQNCFGHRPRPGRRACRRRARAQSPAPRPGSSPAPQSEFADGAFCLPALERIVGRSSSGCNGCPGRQVRSCHARMAPRRPRRTHLRSRIGLQNCFGHRPARGCHRAHGGRCCSGPPPFCAPPLGHVEVRSLSERAGTDSQGYTCRSGESCT